MIQSFTDSEYAVIYDSLARNRDLVRKQLADEGLADVETLTPNIDSALAKLGAWASPSGCQFYAVTGEDAVDLEEAFNE